MFMAEDTRDRENYIKCHVGFCTIDGDGIKKKGIQYAEQIQNNQDTQVHGIKIVHTDGHSTPGPKPSCAHS